MISTSSKNGKKIYKCVHCHDCSIILDSNTLTQPVCPICKGLLRIEDENPEIPQGLTNGILFST